MSSILALKEALIFEEEGEVILDYFMIYNFKLRV
jgi:hypothetical protein